MKFQSQIHESLMILLVAAVSFTNAVTTTTDLDWMCPTNVPAFTSFIICADALPTQPSCVGDSAACACDQQKYAASCMQSFCPPQVTRDILPYVSYYCQLATGGTALWSEIVGGFATATATRADGSPVAATASPTTGGPGTGSGKSAAVGMVEVDPVVWIGTGIVAFMGLLMGWL